MASLSVARAERDDIIIQLRSSIDQHDSMSNELKQELQELHVSLNERNKEMDTINNKNTSLSEQIEILKLQYQQEMDSLTKNAEMELEEATSHIEIMLGKDMSKLRREKEQSVYELEVLEVKYEKDINAKISELDRVIEEYEEAMRQMEDEHMSQLSKARAHCESLTVAKLEWLEERKGMTSRVSGLTGSLKESQNARLDLQVDTDARLIYTHYTHLSLSAVFDRCVYTSRQWSATH